ncbi:MAG TPA: PLP-dependent aminotransferase family protein [Magnetospirillum sp.]|nr:PLP-dependent aminotransferase family protein [Magnetospirillum sp.]
MDIPLHIRKDGSLTFQDQLYRQIRDGILSGRIPRGFKLPSSRDLAHDLSISRNTVTLAFAWLINEGYLESRTGAGTFVSRILPEEALGITHETTGGALAGGAGRDNVRPPILFRSPAPAMIDRSKPRPSIDFWYGRLDHRHFPLKIWRRLVMENLSRAGPNLSDYANPAGNPELRAAIAEHLGATRGMRVTAERIIITAGAQEGVNLLARLLVGPGTRVAVEDPGYQAAATVLQSHGAELCPIQVDEGGLDVEELGALSGVSLLHVTPSHQFPSGATMPLERRVALLGWARLAGAYIIEDDYDSDFRYDGPPLASLAGLDGNDRVIYLGTFSKSVGAGLRLGYLVLPPELVGPATAAKSLGSYGQAWLDQAILCDFIRTGAYGRHLRRLRQAYRRSRDALAGAMRLHFGNDVGIHGQDAGMHIMWTLPDGSADALAVAAAAAKRGVGIYPFPAVGAVEYGPRGMACRNLVLGYSSLSPAEIRAGIAQLAAVVAELGHSTKLAP